MIIARIEQKLDRAGHVIFAGRFLFLFSLILILSKLAGESGADPDLFARVAVGELVINEGTIPYKDPFSFTPVSEMWIDHEWLSGIVFYFLTQWGGDSALLLLNWIFLAATVFLVGRAAESDRRLTGAALWAINALLLLDCTYIWASTIRAQIFTYLFASCFIYQFARVRSGGSVWPLLLQPFIMILWCNAHGGFVIGLIIQGFLTLELALNRRRAQFLVLPIATILATLINPYGIHYWDYILRALSMSRPTITEWLPTLPWQLEGILPFSAVALFLWGWLKSKRRRLILPLMILFFAYCGIRHSRFIALFALTLTAFGRNELSASLGIFAARLSNKSAQLRRAFTVAVIAMFLLSSLQVLTFIVKLHSFRLRLDGYPVGASEWLRREGRGGKLLIDFNNGSFALWRLYPKYKVSLDGRYEELYPNSTVELVSEALTCPLDPSQTNSLARVNPDYILAPAHLDCFDVEGDFTQKWKRVYCDREWRVFSKGENEPIAANCEHKPLSIIASIWQKPESAL